MVSLHYSTAKEYMSKRKKRKFKSQYSPAVQPVASQVNRAVNQTSLPERSAPVDRPKVDNSPASGVYSAHAKEYKQIQADLIKVVIVNGALFALIFVLYFINQSNQFLDNLFNRFF